MSKHRALEQQIDARLLAIQKRLEWISNAEARAAWINGAAADGRFDPERQRLIEETERILDRLQSISRA